MQQHRLIVNDSVILKDYNSTMEMYQNEKALRYQLFYQMSRIGREKGSLSIDDRLDVLAMACSYFIEQIARDQETAVKQRKNELFKAQLDRFLDHQVFDRSNPKQNKWF